MGQCPVCNSSLDANFGMVQCFNCQTVLFVDFAGNISVGGGDEAPEPLIEDASTNMPEGAPISDEINPNNFSVFEEPAPLIQETKSEGKADAEEKLYLAQGTLSYRLVIEGIDTSRLRKNIAEVLSDRRLGLVNDEISGSIRKGILEIKDLNPIKASYLINALKAFPVSIKWSSYVQAETNELHKPS